MTAEWFGSTPPEPNRRRPPSPPDGGRPFLGERSRTAQTRLPERAGRSIAWFETAHRRRRRPRAPRTPQLQGALGDPWRLRRTGESPRAACNREIQEELGLTPALGPMLVVDWAPAEHEGDKLLFIFGGGSLDAEQERDIHFADGELTEWSYVSAESLEQYGPPRLARRIRTAIAGAQQRHVRVRGTRQTRLGRSVDA
ncbi:NUDIX hydrolase [Micromonospora lupini]|uniref:NUDIX hydrolase n=1 Tax=Micromonospora lupini TaxID=285679 RepID=UPI0033CBBA37